MAVDVSMYWIDWDNNEMHSGDIEPFASMHQDSFSGHAFRARTRGGTLVMEHVVRSGQRDKLVKVQPCGGVGEGEIPLWDEGRDKEFEVGECVSDSRGSRPPPPPPPSPSPSPSPPSSPKY